MKRPPFEPNPREVALANYLALPFDEVVAGSFEISEQSGLLRWRQCGEDGAVVWRSVKLEPATLDAVLERAGNDDTRTAAPGS